VLVLVVGLFVSASRIVPTAIPRLGVQTDDTNSDGRPDVWKYYDDRGSLIRVEVDTNFDGRVDVEETLVDGHLIARHTDRNFDGRVDRIDEFDVATGELRTATVDVDFDGRADLQVHFDGGRPIATRWAPTVDEDARVESITPTATAAANAPLQALANPFSSGLRVRSHVPRPGSLFVEATDAGFPVAVNRLITPTQDPSGAATGPRSAGAASPSLSAGSRAPPQPATSFAG
jgi:hypothetical protein